MDPASSDRHYSREDLNMRQAFQEIYKHKLKEIQQFYSEQNKSLKKTLEDSYKKVLSDELLITMIGDRTTSKFIQDRVEECFQNIVYNERQIIIENQSIQITELKFRLEEMVRNMEKMAAQNIVIQNNTHREKASVQGKNAEMLEQLKKKTQDLIKFNLKIKELQRELTDKDDELTKVCDENEELKKTLEQFDSELQNNINANYENYKNQNSELTKCKQTVQKLEKDIQLQSSKTISEYKIKLEQYKQKMTQLINSTQGKESTLMGNRSSVTLAPSDMQRRLAETIKENQKRFQVLKEQKQKQRNQLERKYESRQRETLQYYEKLLEKKVAQVENQASEFWESIKKEEASLRHMIKQYEENYILNEDHQKFMKEREELIFKMKQKMQEYEGVIEDTMEKVDQLTQTINQYEATFEERVTQIHQLQASLRDQVALTKKYESTIVELKAIVKKSEQKIVSLNDQIQRQSSKLTTQQSTNVKSSQDINFYKKQIKEKQFKNKELNDLLEDHERKAKKLENQLMIVNSNYNEIQGLFKENKRVLAELEFKIKQLEHDAQLTTNEYTHKIKKFTQEINSKSEEITNLSSQYKTIQQDFLTLKGAHTELETTNKKLTLEIKYMKDTELTIKEDYSTQVTDLKTRVNEKTTEIQSLKNQLRFNHEKHSQKLKEQIELKKSAENRMKEYKKAVNLMKKQMGCLTSEIKKEVDTVRVHLRNYKIIYENEVTLHEKTFSIQSLEILRNIDHSSSKRQLQQNQKFEQEKKLLAEKFISEKQELERSYGLLMDKEKQYYLEIIQQKEKDLNKMEGEMRGLHYELERKKQEIQQQEKSVQALENKLLRQEEENLKKIKELSNDFETEKCQIIEEYQEKRDITNNEIQELSKTIQKLRIEMENAKATYDEEKLQISSQLRSIQDQEHVVKETAYRKDQELKRLDEQLRRVLDQKNYLEHSLRELSENDQRKMMRIHELEFVENQLNQTLNLTKVKLERTEEQNSMLKLSIKENQESLNKEIKNRVKVQNELKDIKAAIDRNDKFRDLRALQQMTVETQELTNKVNQMKRMSQYLDRTPLRS